MDHQTPLYLASVLALGMAAQWVAWRLRLPAIVLLLGFGFALGAADFRPEEYVDPEILLPMVSLAVGVILFEGGLTLKFREIAGAQTIVLRLVTICLFVTWISVAAAAHWLMNFSWPMATLLGALLTVSGPTVILPLLRQARLNKRMSSIIKWEGIINDPIGAVLAALVFEVIYHGFGADRVPSEAAWAIAKTLAVGILLGGAAAIGVVVMLRRFLAPDYLQNPIILGVVVSVFAISNAVQPESGLVTVTILGLILANQQRATVKHVVEFKENLRVLLISVLFIVLSSRVAVGVEQVKALGWGGLGLLFAVILVVRPVAAYLATIGTTLTRNERLLLCAIHPRGIVAAAVASLLAIRLQDTPYAEQADLLVLATFLVIVGTVLFYGLSLQPIARWLGLAGGEPQGVLFAGASPAVREIALALKTEKIETLLVDTNPENISAARMAGLPVCYASIGSDFVHEQLDLSEIGRLLAMTPNDEVNSLATTQFAEVFGSVNVYQLASPPTSERHERVRAHTRGRTLFREDITNEALQERFEQSATIKKTLLTEDFTIENFRAKYGPSAVILFVVPEPGVLTVSVAGKLVEPKPGQKVIALINADYTSESGVLG